VRIRELDAYFVRRSIRPCKVGAPGCNVVSEHSEHEWQVPTENIAEADGVAFMCPKCFLANGGSVGTHWVLCWRPRVPADVAPKPGRWEFVGTMLDDLTLTAGSSSILLSGPGCGAHFWIERGAVVRLT